jgi:adenosylcobinamide kinase/adenosylcobinamide-phosphate guanylyltransferase
MVRLLLARHGETTWNSASRYQGQTDIPLSLRGRRQAQALAARLAHEPIAAIYASDLQRAAETAGIIAAEHRPRGTDAAPASPTPLRLEPRLREMSFGEWEGLTYAEIERLAPEHLARWNADRLNIAPPGGETLANLSARVRAVLDEITRNHAEQTVLVVAHGGSLRALMCLALGLPASAYWQFRFENASLSALEFHEPGAIVNYLNDGAHLQAIAAPATRPADAPTGGRLVLLLGGARSGKSAFALELARAPPAGRALYVATAEAKDEEMRLRIERHRRQRGAGWETLEAPRGVAQAIRAHIATGGGEPYGAVVVDCVTLLVSNLLVEAADPFDPQVETGMTEEIEALAACARQAAESVFILISNEVGMGLVPPYPLGRAYRDLMGRANQVLAAHADEVYMLTAGIPLRLK